MAYKAIVIPVMIASPGDVAEEREIIRSVIHDWNDVNASKSKVVLSPVGWETHSSPELGARPQELINTRLLKECDLLVGVFWTRLGTPTGKAKSGTVEEIEEHVKAGKPAMIYFSSKPVAPQSINATQFEELKAFREKLQPLGLVEAFDDISQFKGKFSKQLQLCLINNPYLQRIVEEQSKKSETAVMYSDQSPQQVFLSEDARILLKAATQQKDGGTIFKIAVMGGLFIQTGGKQFGGERGRESAKWESALGELIRNELVVPRGHKDQVFEVTYQGWSIADSI